MPAFSGAMCLNQPVKPIGNIVLL